MQVEIQSQAIVSVENGQTIAQSLDSNYTQGSLKSTTCDMTLVDEFVDQITVKIKSAAQDGKFSLSEISGLTIAVMHGTFALFPTMSGSNKKQIALTVLHTSLKSLIAMGILGPEFVIALTILPQLIDSICYVAGGFEKLWEEYIPNFLKWLSRTVWGDDKTNIEIDHAKKVIAQLDILAPTGLKHED